MTARLARIMTRLFPQVWRDRYAEEFEALLEDQHTGLRAVANVIWAAARERVVPTTGGPMQRDPLSFGAMVRHPSALAPMAMSIAALALVLGHIAIYGHAREADEGATAHLWQLLMVCAIAGARILRGEVAAARGETSTGGACLAGRSGAGGHGSRVLFQSLSRGAKKAYAHFSNDL